jgi:hypothetical protein
VGFGRNISDKTIDDINRSTSGMDISLGRVLLNDSGLELGVLDHTLYTRRSLLLSNLESKFEIWNYRIWNLFSRETHQFIFKLNFSTFQFKFCSFKIKQTHPPCVCQTHIYIGHIVAGMLLHFLFHVAYSGHDIYMEYSSH